MYVDNATRKLIINAALVAIAYNDGKVERGGPPHWDGNSVHFSDNEVEIHYNTRTGAMEIEKRENRNPVVDLIGVNADDAAMLVFGECIRTHGESDDIADHVANLAAAIE